MATTDFLPRRIDRAISRAAIPESLRSALVMGADSPEFCRWFDDFLGDALNARYPAVGGTGTEVAGITAAIGGTATLATQGNQATDSAVLSGPGLHWDGDHSFYFAAKLKISAITNVKWSVGIADEQTDTGPINSKASATFNISDFVGLSFDTADDTNVTFQSNGGTTDANTNTSFTLVADTYFIVELVGRGNHVSVFINGSYATGGAEVIEGGVAMMPIFYIEQNDTAARTMTIDWMGIVGPRDS